MTKSKYNMLVVGKIQLKRKKFEEASSTYEEVIKLYKDSIQETGATNDPENLDDSKKYLGAAIKNYASANIEHAKELGEQNLAANLTDIVKHLTAAIKMIKEKVEITQYT